MKLMRELRCFLTGAAEDARARNSWAGSPGSDGLAPYVRLRAVVDGPIDPRTGYVCNITLLDALLRERVAPILREAMAATRGGIEASAAAALAAGFQAAAAHVPPPARLDGLSLHTSPQLSFSISREDPHTMHLTESFEFSAAHRLCLPGVGDAENARLFGKCANANGHGHNYVVEVTVGGPIDGATGRVVDLARFQRTVKERVIDRFDHKHLNLDCPEFAELNPTVENIAVVIWNLLASAIEGARLSRVRVWETPKTFAEYTGESAD